MTFFDNLFYFFYFFVLFLRIEERKKRRRETDRVERRTGKQKGEEKEGR